MTYYVSFDRLTVEDGRGGMYSAIDAQEAAIIYAHSNPDFQDGTVVYVLPEESETDELRAFKIEAEFYWVASEVNVETKEADS